MGLSGLCLCWCCIYPVWGVLGWNDDSLCSFVWKLLIKRIVHLTAFSFSPFNLCIVLNEMHSFSSSAYLMVYSSVPSSVIRSSLFGMVMLWATDFLPLWKKVSGVQILLAIRLFRRSTAMGPLNFNLSSFQLCLKKTSMVYSCRWKKSRNKYMTAGLRKILCSLFKPLARSHVTPILCFLLT